MASLGRAAVFGLALAALGGCAVSPCLRGRPDPATAGSFEALSVARVESAPADPDDPAVAALRARAAAALSGAEAGPVPSGRPSGQEMAALYAGAPAWRATWVVRDARLDQCLGDARVRVLVRAGSCDLGLMPVPNEATIRPAGAQDDPRDLIVEALVIDPSPRFADAPEGRVPQVCPLISATEALSVRSFVLPPARSGG